MGKRTEKATALFYQGYNCTQSVVGAFADVLDIDPQIAMRFCDGLGGGMGRMRLTCGAVSAMALLAGVKLSSGEPGDLRNRAEVYAKVREMAAAFQEKHHSLICGELLSPEILQDTSATPEKRTEDYYRKRPCLHCIADCAQIIEDYLFPEPEKLS